jgi:outer membrane receptor for ferrienterochelin and colicins
MLKSITSLLIVLLACSMTIGQTSTISIPVSGACGMCQDRIETIAKNIIGVQSASYDIDKQVLSISHQEIFVRSELINALLSSGHDADGKTSDIKAYAELAVCCHYKGEVNTNLMIITGTVSELLQNRKNPSPIVGAVVSDIAADKRVMTDLDGKFQIEVDRSDPRIIVEYIGYQTDTIIVDREGELKILMTEPVALDGVTITYRKRTTEVSYLDAIKTQKISSKELLKAACCSLAESFDTTPAVDASMSDAVTGTRRIEMLGLAGPYVQITRENMPDVRGLAALQGLSYTPGPWIEGMQLNMGAGSVVNGFESITGQINVELRKPCCEDDTYLNAYIGQGARIEANTFNRKIINDHWSHTSIHPITA